MTNTPGEHNICRHNPESLTGIYISASMEAQCHIVSENRRKQDESKKTVQVNAVKEGFPYHQVRDIL